MVFRPPIEDKQSQDQNLNVNHLTALLEISQSAYHLKETEIVQQVLAYAVQFTQSEIGYLNFVNEDQGSFQFIAWTELDPKSDEVEFGKDYPLDQAGIWVDCVQAGKPVIYNDLPDLPEKKSYPETHIRLIRHVSVPLFDTGSIRFVLSVGNKSSGYSSMDIMLLSLVGDQLVRILHGKQLENALDKAKYRYEQFVQRIPIGIFRARTTPQDQMIFEYVNPQFCKMLNLTPEDLYKDSGNAFNTIHQDDLDEFINLNQEVIKTRQPFLWEGRVIVEGNIKWLRIESRPNPQENGDTIWHGVQTDITERNQAERAYRDTNALLENRLGEIEQLQEQLRDQAIRDYLTGLFNRRYLDETIDRELALAKRESSHLSVILIDIDHFKSINDTYGHQTGDIVLIELGKLLKQFSRSSDITCRYGGDEFVVVMPKASPEDALKRADEWRRVFEEKRFTSKERRFATTLSMGIASYPLHASSPKGLFQAADQSLYQSKMYNNKVSISRRTATKNLKPVDHSDP